MRRACLVLVMVLMGTVVLSACGGSDDAGAPESSATLQPVAPSGSTASAPPTSTTNAPEPTTPATTTSTITSTSTVPPVPSATNTTQPTATTAVPSTASNAAFAYGFNVAWRADAEAPVFNQRTLDTVEDAGFTWVRIQIYWRDVQREPEWWDPLPIDNLVNLYAGSPVKILATVSNPPDWAVDPTGAQLLTDYEHWATFMQFLANRYRGQIAAYEIWNEQNLASTVRGNVRVADYAQLLEAAHRGIKSGDPAALVVFGGLTPTGVHDPMIAIDDLTYLREFYTYADGAYVDYFDVFGAHANATNHPPDLLYPDEPGDGAWSQDSSFYFRRVELLHAVMQEFDDQRPIWITEFGWTTANQAPGYEYGVENTNEEQATFLVRAFELATTNWEWCTGMFVWNLNYSVVNEPTDEKYPWSVLHADWTPRPAYTALAEMAKP